MATVLQKFVIASALMWIIPIVILLAFNNQLIPGLGHISAESVTLISGFLAVISVNVVIALYICIAMKEPIEKHEPDSQFLSNAESSLIKSPDDQSSKKLQ